MSGAAFAFLFKAKDKSINRELSQFFNTIDIERFSQPSLHRWSDAIKFT
jgi:hypothetical protein